VIDITWQQIVALFVLAIPIACVARTVVFEEVFREPREFCARKSKTCRNLLQRKFFYLFTCEYCFSHYITILFLLLTGYHLMFHDWRGFVIAFFALVFVANIYMNLYSRLRVEISAEKKDIEAKQKHIEKIEREICDQSKGFRPSNGTSAEDHPSARPLPRNAGNGDARDESG
jgi:hypothetical protein